MMVPNRIQTITRVARLTGLDVNWDNNQFTPTEPPPTTTTTTTTTNPLLPADIKQCMGNQFYASQRVIGGEEVVPHSWPYVVRHVNDVDSWNYDESFNIRNKDQRNHEDRGLPFCTGTIITDEWVLTQASCCAHWIVDGLDYRKHYILTGHHTEHTHLPSAEQRKYRIIEMHQHPDYDDYSETWQNGGPNSDFDNNWTNDALCLIKTEKMDLDFETAGVACLSTNMYPPAGVQCFAGSFTQTELSYMSNPGEGTLNSVNAQVLDPAICESYNPNHHSQGNWYLFDPEDQLCVSAQTCYRDDGAPLVCVEDGVPVLYGIRNWGRSGCHGNFYEGQNVTVYESVGNHIHWIEEVITSGGHHESCDYENGWKYDGIEGCLKVFDAGNFTWWDANDICKSHNAHLVNVINSTSIDHINHQFNWTVEQSGLHTWVGSFSDLGGFYDNADFVCPYTNVDNASDLSYNSNWHPCGEQSDSHYSQFICQQGCVSYANWEFHNSSYLGGIALDTGGNVLVYPDNIFDTLHGAQVACTKLGDGCGGMTGWRSDSVNNGMPMYELRRGTDLISSTDSEFSYLKPERQCYYGDTGCPRGWIPNDGVCLKAWDSSETYYNAELICRHNGGHIAILHDSYTAYYLKFMLNGNQQWIGYNDEANEGVWVDFFGEEAEHIEWYSNEPNNCCGGEDCAVLGWGGGITVNDHTCREAHHPFICEIPKGPVIAPLTSTTAPPTTTTPCDECIIPENVQCNGNIVSGSQKIVGGEEAVPHSWNWIARMQFHGYGGCGGSILNSEWILTAAHCCEGRSARDVTFLIGDHLYDTFNGTEHTVQAIDIIMHPEYFNHFNHYENDYYDYYDYYTYDYNHDQFAYNYDICLINVEPITLDGINANIVCLPEPGIHINPNDDHLPDGPDCYVAGWGSTGGNSGSSNSMQSVDVDIYSTEFCNNRTYMDGDFDPDIEFCAGKYEGGKDSCQGDSGGPLICINDQNEPVLYGVVSWGHGCASEGYPGIYAKVSAEIDWIKDTISNYVPWTHQTHFPMWLDHHDGYNMLGYQNASDFCGLFDGRLCTFDEYCPSGEYGDLFDSTIQSSIESPNAAFIDAYSPFHVENGENLNNWLQVGYREQSGLPNNNNTCSINTSASWLSAWGQINTVYSDSKPGVCCNARPEVVYGYECSNVRVSSWYDQCYGDAALTVKNVLAYYEAVVRDEFHWKDSMPRYGIAGFRGGQVNGENIDYGIVRHEDNELKTVPCHAGWRDTNYDMFLVCEETIEAPPPDSVNCTECMIPAGTRCNGNKYSKEKSDFDKIVGGAVVKPNSWLWIVRMQFDTGYYQYSSCSGTIINKHWILTSASCCRYRTPEDITFQVGEHVYSHLQHYEQTVSALEIHMHPSSDYNYYNYHDHVNLCLIKTEEIYLGGVYEDVVCLPEDGVNYWATNLFNQAGCFVAGWGSKGYGASQSDVLHSVDIDIFSNDTCMNLGDLYNHGFGENANEFCAGKEEGGKDRCHGDEGGPLICVENGEPVLYGVVSWGGKCASRGEPGVYVNVTAQMGWMDDVIFSAKGEPTWYDVSEYKNSFGTSYQNISNFCSSMNNARLCTFDEYCPSGVNGPLFEEIEWFRDSYAPFYDPNGANYNSWLQIGYHYIDPVSPWFNSTCWINPWYTPWGLENNGEYTKNGVCCSGAELNGGTTSSPQTTTTANIWSTTTPTTPLATTVYMNGCADNQCLVPEGTKCNSNAFLESNRIINGAEVTPYSWPFAVRMKFNGFSGCGGSIINSEYILTAAHCCEGNQHSPSSLSFVVGEHAESNSTGLEQTVTALEVHLHPYYSDHVNSNYSDSYGMNYDVCLVKVEKMNLNDQNKDIVCLPQQGEHVGAHLATPEEDISTFSNESVKCFVGGWGTTEAGGQSDVLKSVNIKIMSADFCNEETNYQNQFDPVSEFCAGYHLGGKDSCQGDSGGPVICVIDQEPVLYGVVSWGYGCAEAHNPGVYAKVSTVIEWMHQVTGINKPTPAPETTDPTEYTTSEGTSTTSGVDFSTKNFVTGPARMPKGDQCTTPAEFRPQARSARAAGSWKGKGSGKIVGGLAAKAPAWKFIAKVLVKMNGMDGAYIQGGGTIINDEYILTAGHICKMEQEQGAGMIIEIGQYNTNKEDVGEFVVTATNYIIHPDFTYKGDIPYHDICLIRVPSLSASAPEDCNGCFQPVCLPTEPLSPNEAHGDYCWIAGWGAIKANNGQTSNKLRDAGVNIFSHNYCLAKTSYTADQIAQGNVSSHFCAGIPDYQLNDGAADGGQDTCNGDDGGPLICLVNNVPVQLGISITSGCGRVNTAGLYTNVATYRQWMHNMMNP